MAQAARGATGSANGATNQSIVLQGLVSSLEGRAGLLSTEFNARLWHQSGLRVAGAGPPIGGEGRPQSSMTGSAGVRMG